MLDQRQPHWVTYKRVLRYHNNTIGMCLKFRKSKYFDLFAYTYADWANDLDNKRSISDYYVFLEDNLEHRA